MQLLYQDDNRIILSNMSLAKAFIDKACEYGLLSTDKFNNDLFILADDEPRYSDKIDELFCYYLAKTDDPSATKARYKKLLQEIDYSLCSIDFVKKAFKGDSEEQIKADIVQIQSARTQKGLEPLINLEDILISDKPEARDVMQPLVIPSLRIFQDSSLRTY
jgi:hypothetical protein